MDKLKLHSPDLVAANVARIADLFPNCVTEATDEQGSAKQLIDFDLLRQELSDHVVDGPRERYRLDWPGKREALLAANAPIAKTLRPCREESVDFDTTKNLFIEGDNLDALKLLQESYLGKVKLIYIDPPYNTGSDFVYADDFAESSTDYLKRSSQVDSVSNRLVANPDSSGRFHSAWLSMMYSRLRLARNFLRDDGVIFVSIDDGEVSNLRKICDEIFGEENFCTQIIWKKRSTPPNDKQIGAQHDYILVYGKVLTSASIYLRPRSDDQVARYRNPDHHPKGPWAPGDLMANVKGGRYVPTLYFPIVNPRTNQEHYPSSNGNWRFNREKIAELIANDEIYFGEDDKGRPKLKRFLSDVKNGVTWTSLWDFVPFNTDGSKEMEELFDNPAVFENPKPVGLLKNVLRAGSRDGDIVLDFFSGSGSLAHAALALAAEGEGVRRFVLVQIPEAVSEKSEANRAGFRTIAEIGKERVRRVAARIRGGVDQLSASIDLGFRVLKVDSSNMEDVFYTPDAARQKGLLGDVDNVRKDRGAEDLLFQVLLDWGLDLSLPISKVQIQSKPVYFVDDDAIAASFDEAIDEELIRAIAARRPLRAVFRDAGFASDSLKINAEQIFKALSPGTELRTI